MIKYSGRGVTRQVLLIGGLAFKIPRLNYGWPMFLRGLLGNMQEAVFGRCGWEGICPVVWHIPGGWLVVQRRVRVLTDAEFDAMDYDAVCNRPGQPIPAERKSDSFGWLNGRVVAIDYADYVH